MFADFTKSTKNSCYVRTPFDYDFTHLIRERGLDYYLEDKITKYKSNKNWISATVSGTNEYKVNIFINDDDNEYKCSCPYYQDELENCKHIYACMIEYSKKYNLDGFEMYENLTDGIKEMWHNFSFMRSELEDKLDIVSSMISNSIYSDDQDVLDKLDEIEEYVDYVNGLSNIKFNEVSTSVVKQAEDTNKYLAELIEELEDILCDKEDEDMFDEEEKEIEELNGLAILLDLFNGSKKSTTTKSSDYEDFNFDEEELEEDDFFYEDMD